MRKLILPLIFIVLLTSGAGALFTYYKTPKIIESSISKSFAAMGFSALQLPTPQRYFGALVYKDIPLDPDEFSTIGTLTLHYSPFASFLTQKLQSITVEGLKLTGELTNDNSVVIAGWNNPSASLTHLIHINTKNIHFEDASISLLSDTLGGITLGGDLQLNRQGSALKFQASLSGAQKQLSYKAKADGEIGAEGQWQSRVEIEQAKFELGKIKASRVAGLLNINASSLSDAKIIGELQAGALNVANLPWQNASLTIEGALTQPSMIIAAKSAGFEGIELGLNIKNIQAPRIFSGDLHAARAGTLLDYLNSQKTLPLERDTLAILDNTEMLDIGFEHENLLIFKINNESQGINVKGNIETIDLKNVRGSFTSDPFSLPDKGTLKNGQLTLKSNFTYKEKTLDGKLAADINSAALSYGAFPLSNIEGSITLNSIQKLNTNQSTALSCRLLNFKLKHKCTFETDIKNGKPRFKNLNISGDGFELKSPAYPGNQSKTLIEISKFDIKNTLKHFGNATWHGAGTLSGTATLERGNDNALSLRNLHLKSDEGGTLKIKDKAFFELLQMEEFEKETMKLALENFQYDLLEIKANGTLTDQVRISVFGKGRNPYLMQGHDFSLDFEITPDLAPIIAKIFEN